MNKVIKQFLFFAVCFVTISLFAGNALPGVEMQHKQSTENSYREIIPFRTGVINPEVFTNYSVTTSLDVSDSKATVRVLENAVYHSAAGVKLNKVPKSKTFHFTTDAIANQNLTGYISVKLFKDGHEIGRKESTNAMIKEKCLYLDFNTGNADIVHILCRVQQDKDNVGAEVTFKNMFLGEGKYKDSLCIVKPRLELVPGYESCSVYLNKCNANDSEQFNGKVKYKRTGIENWSETFPLTYIPDEKAARSSILRLDEDTQYDLQLIISDSETKEVLTNNFRTLSSKVPVKKIIVIDEDNFDGQLNSLESGSEDGYVCYTSKSGFILNGRSWKEDVVHLENVHHVILDRLTIRGGNKFGISVSGSENIIIRNCDISGFGRTGIPDLSIGYKYCINGESLRDIAGIRIVGSGKMLIERNFIHDSLGKTCPWFYSHPDGAFGILLYSTGGITLRYNDIIGCDDFRWNDVIGGYYNDSEFGSFYRDASIYGNFLAFANDDGIELDGGQMNCRFYQNRVEGTLCGVSTAPCLLGPVYLFENLFCNPGDEFQVANYALKNNFGSFGKGRLHYYNNTIHGNWSGYSGYYSTPVDLAYPEELKAISKNNIFDISGDYYDPGAFILPNDFDFNLFWNSGNVVYAGKLAKTLADNNDLQSIISDPMFVDAVAGDFRLNTNSPALNSGKIVTGLFPDSPDIGAFQKTGFSQLPYRPSVLNTSCSQINLSETNNKQIIYVSLSKKEGRDTFTIKQPVNNDFFEVNPKSGKLAAGEQFKLEISLLPENINEAKVYSGAFLVYDSNGYSRPVSVYADFRNDEKKVKKLRNSVIYGTVSPQDDKDRCFIEFDVKKPGDYFMFGFMSETPDYALIRKVGGSGKFLRTRFYGIVGNDKPTWHSMSTSLYSRKPHLPLKFKKGIYRFEIIPFRGMPYKIKKIALATSPQQLLDSPFIK